MSQIETMMDTHTHTETRRRFFHRVFQVFRFVVARDYKRRPRRPPFRRVLSDGMGVTSSTDRKAFHLHDVRMTNEPMRPILMPERARARRAD